jgi:hypothetical protein
LSIQSLTSSWQPLAHKLKPRKGCGLASLGDQLHAHINQSINVTPVAKRLHTCTHAGATRACWPAGAEHAGHILAALAICVQQSGCAHSGPCCLSKDSWQLLQQGAQCRLLLQLNAQWLNLECFERLMPLHAAYLCPCRLTGGPRRPLHHALFLDTAWQLLQLDVNVM